MKTCARCSAIVDDHAKHCTNCGSPVQPSAGSPAASSGPPIAWQPLTGSPAQTAGATLQPGPSATAPVGSSAPPRPASPPGVNWSNSPSGATQTPPYQPGPFQVPSPQPRQAQPSGTDLKPLIPRTNTSIINRAEEARDRIYSWFETYCRSRGIAPSILKSPPYNPTIWVQIQAWNPADPSRTCTDRCKLLITLTTTPFHRFEILYHVTVEIGAFTKKYISVCELNQGDIERVLDTLVKGNARAFKHVRLTRLKDHWWQFWRPKNKVLAVDTFFAKILAVLCLVATACLFSIMVFPPVGLIGIVLWIIVGIILFVQSRKRLQYQNQGKPMQEPRTLHRLDSWQTLVFDLGPDIGHIRQEILAELRKGTNSGFVIENETIWHWGLDGTEEREQLVARFRRGIAFIQVYAYGQDLFVAWDANINTGTWVEQEVARGSKHGEMFSLRTVVAGTQPYSEFDLNDTNCLLEWVHGAVTKVVKRTMEHRKIDQEIDFKIIRGDRKVEASTDASQLGSERKSQSKLRQLFRRVE
jgi:hypothetical protein